MDVLLTVKVFKIPVLYYLGMLLVISCTEYGHIREVF